MKRWLTVAQTIMTLVMLAEMALVMGTAAFPAVSLWLWVYALWRPLTAVRLWGLCVLGVVGYLGFALCLMAIVPVVRWLTLSLGTPVGRYPYVSFKGYQWASYNMLTLLVRFSVINWFRATPLIAWFHRAMGMRVGARVQIF